MKFFKMVIIALSGIILMGCMDSDTKVKDEIYQKFFHDIVKAGIIKVSPENEKLAVITGKDIQVFKKEMLNITDIKQYTSDEGSIEYLEGNFHLLYIHTKETLKKQQSLGLLYSIKERRMIVRKRDLFLSFKEERPNLTVYEFKVSRKVIDIIEKYEKTLPEDVSFFNSWPLIHNQ